MEPSLTHPLLLRRAAMAGALVLLTFAPALAAEVPTAQELARDTSSGSYLAARHAGVERDSATAAAYYLNVLKSDPRNSDVLSRGFLSVLDDGNIDEAGKLAERLVQIDRNDRIARLVIGVRALKQKQYGVARQNFTQSVRGPVTDLTATLLAAWSLAGAGNTRDAVDTLDKLVGPDWYAIFKDAHAGMILDVANKEAEAGKRYERAYKADAMALRTVQAYASWLSRNGKTDAARKVLTDFGAAVPNHPLIVKALEELGPADSKAATDASPEGQDKGELSLSSRGDTVKELQTKLGIPADGVYGHRTQLAVREFQRRKGVGVDGIVGPQTAMKLAPLDRHDAARPSAGTLPRLVDSAQSGGAEALYQIGSSIGRRGGEDLALVYLQLALYLEPNHAMALLSLADLYESLKKPDLAIAVYDRIPASSPLHRNAEIQIASDLDALDRTDEAKKRLEQLIAEHPKDNEAIIALGNILRGRKDFSACADVYSKAIANIPTPEKSNWVLFYYRGICYERSHQWPAAEADLKKALVLFPDQPLVLNYLGYSWIDQGTNLDEGMSMIRRAVEQRPDDGYIVDSLGWANFRIHNYDEAVKDLERAIELKPEDPTINDHLGDAYWRVGRVLEARFQWSHAKDAKPDPEDLPKIEEKLRVGLPNDTSSAADAVKAKKAGNGGG
jgi:tetratricopeptide (TPR) repeat protein